MQSINLKNYEAGRNDPSSNISSEEWYSYFNRLMNVNIDEYDEETEISTLKNNFKESIS